MFAKQRSGKPIILAAGLALGLVALAGGLFLALRRPTQDRSAGGVSGQTIPLPPPRLQGALAVEEALAARRSVRDYAPGPLTLAEVGQLLWAAQGVTSPEGFRTAPSAGALYPLELYLVVGEVEGLAPGVYHYEPESHALTRIIAGDLRRVLEMAALGQDYVRTAAVDLVLTGVYQRTARRYGERAQRYVHMEAGHAGQNVYLQAEALGLGTVAIGAFNDEEVQRLLSLPAEEAPLYIMPVGRKP